MRRKMCAPLLMGPRGEGFGRVLRKSVDFFCVGKVPDLSGWICAARRQLRQAQCRAGNFDKLSAGRLKGVD
jgi:hypothetical protein